MTSPRQSLLEVTGALSGCADNARFDFGENTALVAVQHMLYQTVDLFRAAEEMGLRPENIFALGKVYSNSAPVIAALRHMGVTVVESTFPQLGEFDESFEQDITRLWETVAQQLSHRHIKRILVLDDGGKCITNIPRDVLRCYEVVGIEQTSQGMFVFEETSPPLAVISWARAAVKLQIGGHIFSQCLIDKLQTEFLRGGSLDGVDIGIIGLGSIGRGLADIASRQDARVEFYDPDPNLEVPRCLRDRVTRLDSLEELMLRSEYLLGSSGRNPFKDKWPMAHRPDIKLFSGSGGDQEFGPIIRDLRNRASFRVAKDTWDLTSDDGPCGPIRIAYLGFPYNFVSRAEEAVPTRIVQLETGGLLASLIQARNYLTLVENGCAKNSGIHRVSPGLQQLVLEIWLDALQYHGIDIRKLYGWDRAQLARVYDDDWFDEYSEPGPAEDGSTERVEALARSILEQCLRAAP
ncbi:MAG TPA: NAD(P)-dependent oxidoreductase [Pyrinomonadaceae bacterium]|nr:NAD(P)-dependent oxidoreductase [Pyrinomonadaceae bacterium]